MEIPELEWNQAGFTTPQDALDAGLQKVRTVIAEPGQSGNDLRLQIEQAKKEIEVAEAKIVALRDEISKYEDALSQAPQGVSEGLKELPEDEPRCVHAINFFSDESPLPIGAVGFRLHKDVDGDGDMDHAFILWSKHKKLVGG